MKIEMGRGFYSVKHHAIDTEAMRLTLRDGAKRRIGHDLYLAILEDFLSTENQSGNNGRKIIMLHRKREAIESRHVHFLKTWLAGLGWQYQHTTGVSQGLWAGLFLKDFPCENLKIFPVKI